AVATDDRARRRKIEWNDWNPLLVDIEPHLELGPVGERENAQALALALAAVVEPPRLRALALGVPAMLRVAQREHALLGTRALLVAARTAKGSIEAVQVERLAQGLRLHHVGVQLRAMCDRRDAALEPVRVGMNDEVEPELAYAGVAERDHLAEFPGRIDMEKRKRRLRRIERLEREMHQDGGILADGIEHHRIVRF